MEWLTFEWLCEAERMAEGDSFYIFSPAALRANIESFSSAVQSYYSNTRFAYSYKTNFTPAMVQIANEHGLYSEVVSRHELEIALRLGVQPNDILFNGPIKSHGDLKFAMKLGVTVNVDSMHELRTVLALACEQPEKTFLIGLRLGFSLNGSHTRFGINIESDDFHDAVALVNAVANVQIVGLHCHFSVGDRNADSYRARIRHLIAAAHSANLVDGLRFIDVGGGFAGKMTPGLRREFACEFPDYEGYAASVGSEMASNFGNPGSPELILEPGMGITADTMVFVCKVSHFKELHEKTAVFATGSIFNIKPFLHKKNIPFRRVSPKYSSPGQPKAAAGKAKEITGYTCMEIDVIYSNYDGPLDVGDFLVFENCGAYTISLAPHFIRMPPAILSAEGPSDVKVIRRASGADEAISTYCLLAK